MARRKGRSGTARKKRGIRRQRPARSAASVAAAALAKARARIRVLEAEIARLREELIPSGRRPGAATPHRDDGPLAPGM
jgi:hypothetical protein